MSVDTTSNLVVEPSTAFEKLKAGTSAFVEFNLYCCVGIPFTVSFFTGLPKVPFTGKAAFKTFVNCSFQSGLEGSFHKTV